MSSAKKDGPDSINTLVYPQSEQELILTIKHLSLENERQKGVIQYQREEIQKLSDRMLVLEKRTVLQIEDTFYDQSRPQQQAQEHAQGQAKAQNQAKVQNEAYTPNQAQLQMGSLLPLLESIEDASPPTREKNSILHQILTDAFLNKDSRYYEIVNNFLVGLILFSVLGVTLESVPSLMERWKSFFYWSELIVVGLFTVEYIINIYVAENKLGYIFSLWGLIDLIAILPSYFHMMDLRDIKLARTLRIIRFLRTIRMLRILKLARNTTNQYQQSAKQRVHTLKIDLQIYVTALFTVIIICSTLIYYAERNTAGTAFTSIPAAMWWCVVTTTTVGYGDMYPATLAGKLIAAATMIIGLALFGILMNVIGKAMMTSLFGTTNLD